jgi:hypothetical protein
MTRSPRSPKVTATRAPEAEKAFLAGLLELVTDNPARCREAAGLVPADAFTIEGGPELLAAIAEAAALEAPTLADVVRIARERSSGGAHHERGLVADLAKASVGNPGGYARGVDRHAREIMRAAGRRRTIEAARVAEAVAIDPAAEPAEIEAAAAAVAAASVTMPTEQLAPEPFPVGLLPDPAGTFVAEVAETLSTDPVFVAFPLLAAVAATVGNRRRIELWPGWTEPAILWLATVADSGSKKSPGMDKALQFTRQRQDEAFAEHRVAVADWEREKREHDRAARRRDADPAALPERPEAERYICDDVTIEGLARILEKTPRGVLLARDELSGWIEGFDRYSGGRGGGEVARWLSCYNASPMTVDRKLTGTLHIPAATVSIYGGIQPAVLARVALGRHVDNGLVPRFILASPPKRMRVIPSGDVGFATIEAMRSMFETLAAIRSADDGSPRVIDLEPEAAEAWRAFYNEHARELYHAEGVVASMLAKAEAWAARLALVHHMIAQAGCDPTRGDRVRIDSIEAGVGIARWAAREWCRVFDGLRGGRVERDDTGLREWIAGRGGVASARDVARGLTQYRSPGAAEAGLRRLVRSGAAEWQAGPTRGRPADAVRLK